MSIEVLRLLADKFEENGILCVDSHKLGELISDMDDTWEPKLFQPMAFQIVFGGVDPGNGVDKSVETLFEKQSHNVLRKEMIGLTLKDFAEKWNKHKGFLIVQEKEISKNNETNNLHQSAD